MNLERRRRKRKKERKSSSLMLESRVGRAGLLPPGSKGLD
jgi:hypothetical protein